MSEIKTIYGNTLADTVARENLSDYVLEDNIGFLASETGKYVKSDGTLGTSGAYRVSDYIPIPDYVKYVTIGNTFKLGSTTYHLSPAFCLFDASKNAITGQTGSTADYATYAIPTNAKYLRFNQPNENNASVNSAVTGFWFNQTNTSELDNALGDKDVSITFSSASQVVDSDYAVRSGQTYRITLNQAYSPSTWAEGRINIFSDGSGGSANYVKYYADTNFVDFVCKVDGSLCFYNTGGFVGTVKFHISSELDRVVNADPITYVVGQYEINTSLTALLLSLKDDKRPKTIIIKGGDYDIFQEYKDLQDSGDLPTVPDSDYDPSTGYVPYNVFIPDNTHIIGQGLVRLMYQPDVSDTTLNESRTLSPINVAGSMILENVEIHQKNGRYCIHDDPIRDPLYNGAVKQYKNVKCIKYVGDLIDGATVGTTYAFGCGVSREMTYIFDNCWFETKSTYSGARTFYFHDRSIVGEVTLQDKMSSRIIAKNCVFKSASENLAVFFGNTGAGIDIRVDIDSCWTNGNIVSADEGDASTGNNTNSFEITVLLSVYNDIIIRDESNTYTPVVLT